MELYEKTLESRDIFNGRVLHIMVDKVELPNGHISEREVVGHPGGVCIAALNDNNELYFVRQHRYPYRVLHRLKTAFVSLKKRLVQSERTTDF